MESISLNNISLINIMGEEVRIGKGEIVDCREYTDSESDWTGNGLFRKDGLFICDEGSGIGQKYFKIFDTTKAPDGYIPGMDRSTEGNKKVSHLYKGTFYGPGQPMCKKGWNRDDGESYSIWRNNISKKGICKTCLKNALLGKAGVSSK